MKEHDAQLAPTISVPEASRVLGVSESTVRRWAKSGKLPAERQNGRQDGSYTWRIGATAIDTMTTVGVTTVPTTCATVGATVSTNGHSSAADGAHESIDAPNLGGLVELLAQQNQRLAALGQRIDALHSEKLDISNTCTFLQAENGQLKDRIKLLQPPVAIRHWYNPLSWTRKS